LLHTWSLSVEWQFYLLLPVYLLVVWRLKPGRAAQAWALAVGLGISYVLSVLTTDRNPTAAFFLIQTRAWEMMVGGAVFLMAPLISLSNAGRKFIEIFGLGLIVFSVALFKGESIWPGWRAMVPVLGAAMVIFSNGVSIWNSNKLSQWIGDRSYSIYLWHWPVCVALVYLGRKDEYWAVAGGVLISLVLGHLSFILIENKTRYHLGRLILRDGAVVLIGFTALVGLPAVAFWEQNGVIGRFAPEVELAAAESNNFNPRRGECHPAKGATSPSCVYGGKEWKVLVIGDSHADALVSAVAQARTDEDAGVVQWTYSGCPFVPGIKQLPHQLAKFSSDYKCVDFIGWEQDQLKKLPGNIPAIIAGRYAEAAFGPNESQVGLDIPSVYFTKIYTRTTPEFLSEFSAAITATACELAKGRKVYLVRPIPEMGIDIPKILSRRMIFNKVDDLYVSIESYRNRNSWVWAAQDKAHDECGVTILDPTVYLCRDGRCYGSMNGRPLYHDDDHLSQFGNKLLVPMFKKVFEEL
jgi:hypothetical protein